MWVPVWCQIVDELQRGVVVLHSNPWFTLGFGRRVETTPSEATVTITGVRLDGLTTGTVGRTART